MCRHTNEHLFCNLHCVVVVFFVFVFFIGGCSVIIIANYSALHKVGGGGIQCVNDR